MSFPAVAYTSSSAAISDFLNKAKANGLNTSTSMDVYAVAFATLANLFEDLPGSTSFARAGALADAGNIPANVNYVELSNETEAAYAAVLVAPAASEYGLLKVIALGANDADEVTIDVTNAIGIPGSDTLATFDAEDEVLALLGTPAGWVYIAHSGVTFSTPV